MTKETKVFVIDALQEYIGDVKALMAKIEYDRPGANDYQTLEDLLVRTEYVTHEEIQTALTQGGFSSWRELSEVRSKDGDKGVTASIATLKGVVRFVTEEIAKEREKLIQEAESAVR